MAGDSARNKDKINPYILIHRLKLYFGVFGSYSLYNYKAMEKRFGGLSSSVDPQQLSLTVTAALRSIMAVLVAFGYVTTVQMDTTLMQVPVIVMSGYAAWQGLDAIYGALRKVLIAFTQRTE